MQNSKLYVVPATDDKGQPQYFVHEFNSAKEARDRVALVARARGWEPTGLPVVATENF
jgi:hypothetical protein